MQTSTARLIFSFIICALASFTVICGLFARLPESIAAPGMARLAMVVIGLSLFYLAGDSRK